MLEKSSVPRLLWAVLRPALETAKWRLELPALATYLQREQSNCHLVVAALGLTDTRDGRPAATTDRSAAEKEWNPGQQLVHAYLQSLGSRGSDVNLSTGAMSRPRSGQQQSMETTLWKWKLAYKWHWQMSGSLQHEGKKGETSHEFKKEHINVLELRALVHGVRWSLRSYKSIGTTCLRGTDSRVVQGVVSKYRSSSKQLHRILKRLAVMELASSTSWMTAFVRSDLNVADAGSRSLP